MMTLALLALAFSLVAATQNNSQPMPVVVELFTSEGCSSCPPADKHLSELIQRNPLKEAKIIALAYHVDYWDHLGWKDPFASEAFTARQREYAAGFGTNRIYTPQMIVNGRTEFVGSDRKAAKQAIAAAVGNGGAQVSLRVHKQDGAEELTVGVDRKIDQTDELSIMFAITEDELATKVRRGENAGRTLRHDAVVRELRTIGKIDADQASLEMKVPLALPRDAKRENVNVVVFLQNPQTRHIVGGESVSLATSSPGG